MHVPVSDDISRSVCEFSLEIVGFPKAANNGRALKAGKGSEHGRIQAKKLMDLSVLWGGKSLILMPEKKGNWSRF